MKANNSSHDPIAALAEALFIANLLFVGIFYLGSWILYLTYYKNASPITQNHLKQTLAIASLSTFVFISINTFILLTDGYKSVTALFSLEIYFMLLVPLFFICGILGFSKAIKGLNYRYPIIARYLNLNQI